MEHSELWRKQINISEIKCQKRLKEIFLLVVVEEYCRTVFGGGAANAPALKQLFCELYSILEELQVVI